MCVAYVQTVQKIAQSLMHCHLHPFAIESRGFPQTAQKLTGNTKNEQILNIVISIFFGWQLVRELLKKHQYRRYF